MSQRKFQSSKVDVLCGWDRPLQEFFLSVFDESVPEDQDDGYILYSTLDEEAGFGTDAWRVIEQLEKMGFSFPASLHEDLERDRELNAGSLVVVYQDTF